MAFDHEKLDAYRLGLEFQFKPALEVDHRDGKDLLEPIVAMVVKLARSFEDR